MKQIFFDINNKVVLHDVPAPFCEDNGILVEVKYSLISSGTESKVMSSTPKSLTKLLEKNITLGKKALLKLRSNGIKSTFDQAISRSLKIDPVGYSAAGVILERGQNIQDLIIGDSVACAGVGFANHAEIIYVPRNLAVKVPENVPLEQASFTALGSIAMQAVRQSKVQVGENVVVIGLGLVGLLVLQILNAAGCRVVGIDLDEERIKLGTRLGLLKGLALGHSDIFEEVQISTEGHGADAVIICAATKNADPVKCAVELVRKKGRVVIVGVVDISIPRAPFYEKEVELTISHSYGPGRNDESYEEYGLDYPYPYVRWTENRNMEEFLKMLSEKKVDVKELISLSCPIEKANEAYESFIKVRPRPVAVILTYGNLDIDAKSKRKIDLQTKKVEKDKINVAVIGCGGFAKEIHLPNLNRMEGFNLKAIVSRTGSNVIQTAKMFHSEYVSTDYEDVLRDKDIDMVLISTRHNLHAPMAIAAAKAGKDVFVEKPMALTLEECKELYKIVQETKINFTIGYNRRFSPITYEVKRLLENIKAPLFVNYRVNAGKVPKDHWVQDPTVGGGRIIGEVCHFVDFINYIVDEEIISIYAESMPIDNKTVNNLDNIAVTMKYRNGSLSILTYTSLGDNALEKELIEIYTAGHVIVINDFKSAEFYGFPEKGIKLQKQDKGFINEMTEFQRKIRGQPSNSVSVIDGVKSTLCTLKILESIEKNSVLRINCDDYLEL